MLSLVKSQRFQEEYNRYKEIMDSVSDETVKKKLDALLTALVTEIRSIDTQHSNILSNKNAVTGDDSKNRILEIRRQLDRISNDWYESQRANQKLD